MTGLQPGETIDLGNRVGGGPEVYRDENCTDGYAIDGHGGELYRDEIKRLAELAGFAVNDRPSKMDHAEQMAGIRTRAEHAAACVSAGKVLTLPYRDNDE